MFRPAVNPDEVDQDLQIILLWDGELFHGCILDGKVNGRHDAGQKIPFAHLTLFFASNGKKQVSGVQILQLSIATI